jgi:hypothetical protein
MSLFIPIFFLKYFMVIELASTVENFSNVKQYTCIPRFLIYGFGLCNSLNMLIALSTKIYMQLRALEP